MNHPLIEKTAELSKRYRRLSQKQAALDSLKSNTRVERVKLKLMREKQAFLEDHANWLEEIEKTAGVSDAVGKVVDMATGVAGRVVDAAGAWAVPLLVGGPATAGVLAAYLKNQLTGPTEHDQRIMENAVVGGVMDEEIMRLERKKELEALNKEYEDEKNTRRTVRI
jgi:hypothetical protein